MGLKLEKRKENKKDVIVLIIVKIINITYGICLTNDKKRKFI